MIFEKLRCCLLFRFRKRREIGWLLKELKKALELERSLVFI